MIGICNVPFQDYFDTWHASFTDTYFQLWIPWIWLYVKKHMFQDFQINSVYGINTHVDWIGYQLIVRLSQCHLGDYHNYHKWFSKNP